MLLNFVFRNVADLLRNVAFLFAEVCVLFADFCGILCVFVCVYFSEFCGIVAELLRNFAEIKLFNGMLRKFTDCLRNFTEFAEVGNRRGRRPTV